MTLKQADKETNKQASKRKQQQPSKLRIQYIYECDNITPTCKHLDNIGLVVCIIEYTDIVVQLYNACGL